MFYLFLIPGVNEGENTVLRREKEKIARPGPWMGLWGLVLEEVFIGASLMITPTLDLSERKAVIPALLELLFLFTINPGP